MSKKNKAKNSEENQKKILLKILNIQNEGIEGAMESINVYLSEAYAHNISLMHILRENLK